MPFAIFNNNDETVIMNCEERQRDINVMSHPQKTSDRYLNYLQHYNVAVTAVRLLPHNYKQFLEVLKILTRSQERLRIRSTA